MRLTEVFDSSPAPIKWVSKSARKWVGEFVIDDIPYRLFFSAGQSMIKKMQKQAAATWELSFSVNTKGKIPPSLKNKIGDRGAGGFGVLGTGNQGKVFSTVMKAMKDLIAKEKPAVIQFSAEEHSRMKLYQRMVKKYALSFGYKPVMTGDYFELVRKD